MLIEMPSGLLLAVGAYALGTASPGPSNLAVMATAVERGRKPALLFALGVVAGSTVWGLAAALGLSALMARASDALVLFKILGGLYLLWLAFKAARSACARSIPTAGNPAIGSVGAIVVRGMAMHLTNPKAIFVWLSLVTLALPPGATQQDALLVVAACVPIGLVVFCGYALLFSTHAARTAYRRSWRGVNVMLAALFGYAGLRMLLSRTSS